MDTKERILVLLKSEALTNEELARKLGLNKNTVRRTMNELSMSKKIATLSKDGNSKRWMLAPLTATLVPEVPQTEPSNGT